MTDTSFLYLNNLTVDFEHVTLFRGVSLSLKAGDKVTLSGPSGSGKSTILRCIIGFVPFEGTICLNSEPLTAQSVWRLRQKIAYVAQEPDLGPGTVEEALARPFTYKANQELSLNPQEVNLLFDHFLLPASLQSKEMGTLSGGEKQRVALISALLLKRPLLLLDEAASALDTESKGRVRDYLRAQSDITILSVSHDTRDFILSETMLNIQNLSCGESS